MHPDLNSLIKTVHHQDHIIECLNRRFGDSFRSVWHDTKDQRGETLLYVFELNAYVFNRFKKDPLVRPACLIII